MIALEIDFIFTTILVVWGGFELWRHPSYGPRWGFTVVFAYVIVVLFVVGVFSLASGPRIADGCYKIGTVTGTGVGVGVNSNAGISTSIISISGRTYQPLFPCP